MNYKLRTKNPKMQKLIDVIAKKIVDRYKPQKIILFGSYAYGHPRKDSDLDLLVIKKTFDRHIDRSTKVREIIDKENCIIAIEPLVYTQDEINTRLEMEDDFIKKIIEEGIILYE